MPTYKDYPLNGIDYEYEVFESEVVTGLLRHGMHCIDLGANTGHFTMLMALYTGSSGRVLSVEPDPVTQARCRQNVWSNGLRTVDMLCVASGKPGVSRLHLDTGGGGDNRLKQYPGENRSSILVPVLGLDELCDLLPDRRVDFIKIDVQGAEPDVLANGDGTFARNPHMGMLVEYDPYALEGHGHAPRVLTDRIHSLGFRALICNVVTRRLMYLPPGKAIRREVVGDRGVVNLLCLRGRFAEQLPNWLMEMIMHVDPAQLEDALGENATPPESQR